MRLNASVDTYASPGTDTPLNRWLWHLCQSQKLIPVSDEALTQVSDFKTKLLVFIL